MSSDTIKCAKCNQPLRFNSGEPAIFHHQDCPDGKDGSTYVARAAVASELLAESEEKAERFFVRFNDENYNKFWELVDRETGEVVGSDGGEPEDALLVRDFGWVVGLANRLHAEKIALSALGQWQPIETATTYALDAPARPNSEPK